MSKFYPYFSKSHPTTLLSIIGTCLLLAWSNPSLSKISPTLFNFSTTTQNSLFTTDDIMHTAIGPQQTYQSCSIITREYISAVQLYRKGFALDTLKETLPGLTPQSAKRITELYKLLNKNGILSTYSTLHSKYAACAKSVYQTKKVPPQDSLEYGYYFCAGEDKLRYEIALAIYLKATKEEVLPQIPEQRKDIAAYYFQVASEKGIEALFDLLAHSLKSCLIRADPSSAYQEDN